MNDQFFTKAIWSVTMETSEHVEEGLLEHLQEEISNLNNVGLDLFYMGKLMTSVFHFNQALLLMKRLSKVKKLARKNKDEEQPTIAFPSDSKCDILKLGQPIPIDSETLASVPRWELIVTLALIHNSAVVYYEAKSFENAEQMLRLAIRLLKYDLTVEALNHLMSTSMYAATIVVSIYTMLGKTKNQIAPGTKETKKALKVADGLKERFMKNRV